ncbi:MAG: Hsp20/alpha crystallin family protein [Eubacteriales bacterium]|nr:Hsp20/alpha crystallin family protein [Eubacteriales bacterium]
MFELIPFDRTFRRMTTFDPFREMADLERSFMGANNVVSAFRTDVSDNGEAFILESELPGFKKEDIGIDIKNDCLTISVERKLDEENKKANFLKRERFYGAFSRSFDVTGINTEEISAKYADGILTLTLPKKVETVPAARRLEIQ